MKFLSRSEEMILLAIYRLEDSAYGVTIREQLKMLSGKTWAYGALFVMLDRLSKKGMLDSYLSEPTGERGGRSKRMYKLTPAALKALEEVKQLQESMWDGIAELSVEKAD